VLPGAALAIVRVPKTLYKQEIKQRMSKRWAWLAGLAIVVLIAFLLACGNTYNGPGASGLVIVSSQGSGLLETFSFSLLAGNNIPIQNSPINTQLQSCVLNGQPAAVVLDPTGTYAYTIVNGGNCPNGQSGIQAFHVESTGNLTAVGSLIPDKHAVALSMDPAGKFLFVLEGINQNSGSPVPQVAQCYHSTELGACSYAIGSGGSLTSVPGTYNFVLPPGFQAQYYFSALAPTPTVLPPLQNGVQTAVCSNPGNNPAKTEFLYVTDSANGVIWEFGVNTSTGALTNPPNQTSVPYFPNSSQAVPDVLQAPSGIAVEPCNRFVYVTNMLSNTVAGFSICNGLSTASTQCAAKLDGSLWPVPQSPFSVVGPANGPGPVVADPFGNYIYVLNTLSNTVSPFHISPVAGGLTAGTTVGTGGLQTILQQGQLYATSIAIRGDDNWLFVTNYNTATLAEFSVVPATGALQSFPTITTDDYPYGVAVK
jgi:6-phosphogluconolactonase (cycloisomerase 2 family)